jgi:quaternary ammonium compound-resistance protein SugE
MAWTYLLLAGIFEIGFTTFLKLSNGMKDLRYGALFLACSLISFFCLSKAIKTIPLGTAYAVWMGIGIFGTSVIGIVFYHEPSHGLRVGFLVMLLVALIGLRVTGT